MSKATAVANPNIALIKHWGKIDETLNLPANPSVSMNLAALTTVTTVELRPGLQVDTVTIDGKPAVGEAFDRVLRHLDWARGRAGITSKALVVSRNDFPAGTGLASSASAFAALSLAAAAAVGLDLDEQAISRFARLGSGSACRSVPAGFSLWEGDTDESSYARQVAKPDHWDLVDVVAIVAYDHKVIGSQDGHALAPSSPLHQARLDAVPGWLDKVLGGIRERDLAAMGPIVEREALAMHGVMMTSMPSLLYWTAGTVAVLQSVQAWRRGGLAVYFTLDAGPNVHCLCELRDAPKVERRLWELPDVKDVLVSRVGGGARLVDFHLF